MATTCQISLCLICQSELEAASFFSEFMKLVRIIEVRFRNCVLGLISVFLIGIMSGESEEKHMSRLEPSIANLLWLNIHSWGWWGGVGGWAGANPNHLHQTAQRSAKTAGSWGENPPTPRPLPVCFCPALISAFQHQTCLTPTYPQHALGVTLKLL